MNSRDDERLRLIRQQLERHPMDIAALSELQTPEEVVRRFTPLGLSAGGMLTPEAAAEFQQRVIASAELLQPVPEDTRASFERLRTLHRYGILCYDAFTAVSDLAPLVADQALRERFVEFHAGAVVVLARDGGERELPFGSVGELVERLKAEKLRLRDWPRTTAFAGGFGQLLHWARRHDLLSGQRARHAEELLLRRRNRLAHPDGHHLVTPVQSARDIHDLAEMLNRLWGAATPGGRLYPALVQREVLALAYQDDGRSSVGLACSLDNHASLADATILLIRGVLQDAGLFDYDAAFEDTRLPTDLLWGPGSYREAITWLDEQQPQSDAVDHLDRWFVLQGNHEDVHRPRHPRVFATLPESERAGSWTLVRADFPQDAFIHVRDDHQPFAGPCGECASEGHSVGTWVEVKDALVQAGVEVMPAPLLPARMPGLLPT